MSITCQRPTDATLAQVLERWLEMADLAWSTRVTYKGYIERTILPTLGHLSLRRLDTATLDRFYTSCVAAAALVAGRWTGHCPPDSRDPAPGAGSRGPLGLDSSQPGGPGQPTPSWLG